MRDFTAIVRRNLGRLPLEREREEEILTELAHQLEDSYKDALARGLPEARAEAEAMTQLGDWEKLRLSILTSERGARVLWPHPWAVPRPVSWLALAIVAGMCLVPGFRQALREAPSVWSSGRRLSEHALRELAARGLRTHDPRMAAFAVLYLEDRAEAGRLAEQVIALDPSLTWIGSRFLAFRGTPDESAVWAKRLTAWDPENAVPRLFALQPLYLSVVREGSLVSTDEAQLAQLAETTPWVREMQATFDASRFDTYDQRRFDLEQSVLRTLEGERSETLVAYSVYSLAVPDSLQAARYAALITENLGPAAEQARRYDEAARMYWSVARFGEHMDESATLYWDRRAACRLESSGYARLEALAQERGNREEAVALHTLRQRVELLAGNSETVQMQGRLRRWESTQQTAAIAWIGANLLLLSAFGCGVWAALVAFRRPEKVLGGGLGALAMAASYSPGLLLCSSAVLYAAMAPFLRSPFEFATRQHLFEEMVPFWFTFWSGWNSFGLWRLQYILGNMAWPALESMVVLILGIAALRCVGRMRGQAKPAVD